MALKKISAINDEFDVKLFFYIAKKCLIYVILLLGIAFAVAFFYLRYTHKIYSSSATIQITSNSANIDKIFGVGNVFSETQTDLDQAIGLIRSSVFLGQAFEKLPLKVSYFYEGRILADEQYKTTPYTVDAKVNKLSIYDIPIFIKFISAYKFELSYTIPGSPKYKKEFSVSQKVIIPEAELDFQIINPVKLEYHEGILAQNSYFFVINNPDNIVAQYSEELSISVVNNEAKTFQITIKDRNPKRANDLVNAIVENYMIYGVAKRSESANSVLAFIDKQLKVVYDTLFQSEMNLENFKKTNKLDSSYGESLPSVYSRVHDIEDLILKIDLEESLYSEVETSLNDKDIDIYKLVAILAGSEFKGTISGFLSSIQALLLQKEQLLYEVTKNSSQIEAINYKIEIQKKMLSESIKILKVNLEKQKTKLNKVLDDYQNTVFSSRDKVNTIELSRLERMYNINEEFYNTLITQKANYQISKAGYVSEIVVLERSSIPKSPISPRNRLIYLVCIITAIVICIGLVLVRYLFYNEITSIKDIIKYSDAPILGIIPKYRKSIPASQLIVDQKPKSLIAEALRSIRTNLQFISSEPGPKIIAVTSTISGEGKTFVAINLAGIMAFSEKKVIVLDFDLRKPKIHIGFGVENKKGVSTIILGLNNIDECIQHSAIKHLDFIIAGPVPPNPAEIMLNPKMIELVNYLKTKYDYIFIDNPPIGIVTDGMPSLLLADYPIYVFKANTSKRAFVQNVDRLIAESNLKKLSIILNSVESQHTGYSYSRGGSYNAGYGYGYGYAYGYGYGYYDEDHLKPIKKKFFLERISSFILKNIFRIN